MFLSIFSSWLVVKVENTSWEIILFILHWPWLSWLLLRGPMQLWFPYFLVICGFSSDTVSSSLFIPGSLKFPLDLPDCGSFHFFVRGTQWSLYWEAHSFSSHHTIGYANKIIFLPYPIWRTYSVGFLSSWAKSLASNLFSFGSLLWGITLKVVFCPAYEWFSFGNYFLLLSILPCTMAFNFYDIVVTFQGCSIFCYLQGY